MNNTVTSTKFPLLIQKINDKLELVETNVSAKAIKKRKIHLLEWALLAPLTEIDDPKPTLEDIANEFGIEKIEFLEHVAKSLTSMGILSKVYGNKYDITEVGQKLYRKGEMISDPRNIKVSIYYEPSSKEWLVGSANTEPRELDLQEETHSIDCNNLPDKVPEKLLNKHVSSLGILDKGESVEEPSIEQLQLKISDVGLSIFLKKDGLDIAITKSSFAEEHHALIKKILKERLITNGGFSKYLKEYNHSVELSNCPVKECHNLDEVKIYQLADTGVLTNDILRSEPKWLINSNQASTVHIKNSKIKPPIVVHMINSSDIDIRSTDSQIIPSSIEVKASDQYSSLCPESIVTEQYKASIQLIEASGYKIPFYILEQTDDIDKFETELYQLFSLAGEQSKNQLYSKVGSFILKPENKTFNDILESCPTNKIKDLKSAKQALNEILGLRNKLAFFDASYVSSASIYKVTLDKFDLGEMISLDMDTIFHCRTLYLKRLDTLVQGDIHKAKNSTQMSISSSIIDLSKSYNSIGILESRVKNSENEVSREILEQTSILLSKLELAVEQILTNLSTLLKRNEIEEIYDALNPFESGVKQKYLNTIKAILEEKLDALDPTQCIGTYKLLYKHGIQPKEATLRFLANKKFKEINWNLLEPKFAKQITSLKNDFKVFDNIFNVSNLIKDQFPYNVEMASDKDQIQIFFNNLIALRKTGILDTSEIKQLLNQEYSLLRNSDELEKIPAGIFLLANAKRNFGKDKLLDVALDDIWEYVYPLLIINKDARKRMEGDLQFLGLKQHLEKFDAEQVNRKLNSEIPQNGNKDQKNQLLSNKPPIKRIIIDGSNVARQDHENGKGSITQLLQAYDNLKNKYGFEDIQIIVGAGLRHNVNDFDQLEPYINEKIAQQAPAGVSDDEFIIKIAIDKDLLILTNDMYKEFRNKDPELNNQIQRRRTAYMIDHDTGTFTFTFPDY